MLLLLLFLALLIQFIIAEHRERESEKESFWDFSMGSENDEKRRKLLRFNVKINGNLRAYMLCIERERVCKIGFKR